MMTILSFPTIIGISGISSATVHTQVAQCMPFNEQRPLCLTTNIIASELGREATYTVMSDIFLTTPENVLNIVRCKMLSSILTDDAGVGVYRMTQNCHGVRISLSATSAEKRWALRNLLPKAIIILDVTKSAFQTVCEGKMHILSALLSDFSLSTNAPIVNYAFIHIGEEKNNDGFGLHDGIRLVRGLMLKINHPCRFGISGTINESIFPLITAIKNWKELSINAQEGLRPTKTSEFKITRVRSFLEYAYGAFDTEK